MTAYDPEAWTDFLVAAAGALAALGSFALISRAQRADPSRAGWPARRFLAVLGTAPVAIGGLSLLAESGGGLFWLLAGVVIAIAGSVANAWVLLVEILR